MNAEYWAKRIKRIGDEAYKSSEIKKIYKEQYYRMEIQVQMLYNKLMKQGGKLTRTEISRSKHYLDMLDVLKNNNTELANDVSSDVRDVLTKAFTDTYGSAKKIIGDKKHFSVVNKKMVDAAISKHWIGKGNFSDKIWKNTSELGERIKADVLTSLVSGSGIDTITKTIMNDYNVGFRQADRLVRTETMHTINEAQRSTYQDEGVKKIEVYCSDDERLCEECNSYFGKTFSTDDESIILPIHPGCRCCWLPVID